jgi:3-dehydro-L-gulonate 2-dehydrogenase
MPTRIRFEELKATLERVLLKLGFSPARAELCAGLFAETSRDGVYSHGLNRFPRFVEQIKRGVIDIHAKPEKVAAFGALERWDGRGGPGNLNAHAAMERTIELARTHGMGCVALANTNHWMRGGSYGWQAVEAGLIGICWTNTMANLPPWGAADARIGNNPIILAVPRKDGPVILDMAMSQFSFGALEGYRLRGERLPVDGGFDQTGQLTRDPGAIEASNRPLPIGYWKGSGLSVMLDLLGALLSGGLATHQIKVNVIEETRLTQVFLAFDLPAIDQAGTREAVVENVLASLRTPGAHSPGATPGSVRYPGERILATRAQNLAEGIPVEPRIWQLVQEML